MGRAGEITWKLVPGGSLKLCLGWLCLAVAEPQVIFLGDVYIFEIVEKKIVLYIT